VSRAVLGLALILPLLASGVAHAQPDGDPAAGSPATDRLADYDPYSTDWNGLASLVKLAEGAAQLQVHAVTSLDWRELEAEDILFLMYPLRRVDPARLDAFSQAGGHAVIADDFGEADDAFARLQLVRAQPQAPRGLAIPVPPVPDSPDQLPEPNFQLRGPGR